MEAVIASFSTAFVAGAVALSIASIATSLGKAQRRYHYHRFGRSVEGESEALRKTMELVRHEDVTGCGLRLVCELAATPPHLLDHQQLAMLDLVGKPVTPGWDLQTSLAEAGGGALGEYRLARGFGHAGGDCGWAFPLCPYNATRLMGVINSYMG